MKVAALKSLFRAYADESDTSFLSTADVELYLELGYNRFRKMVNSVDEMRYATYSDIAITGDSHDLTGVLLGEAAPAANRMQTLLSVNRMVNDKPAEAFSPVSRQAELYHYGRKRAGSTAPRYVLVGRSVMFDRDVNSTVRFTYIPYNNITWTADSYVDDLEEFHDLIPMLGYYNYAIRDGVSNQALSVALAERKMELRESLMEGISREHSTMVTDSPDWL